MRDKLPAESVERREAVQVLGLCYYLTGRFAEAIPLLEETRGWAADNLELGYILGMAYIQNRQPDAARRSLARTFNVEPESAAAHLLAAQMMIRLEMEPFAETELKRALEKDPRIPRAHYLLGQMALFRGKLDEAVALSERELSINPGDGDGAVPARRRAPPRVAGGRRDRGLAEIHVGESLLQRTLHPAGSRIHEKGATLDRGRHAAPGHSVRSEQPVCPLPARPASAADGTRWKKRSANSR